uniref:Secreted protein n=1 Tax=Arundo donax TaxID=35708 RepID=A0A0A9H9X8_ARUDO
MAAICLFTHCPTSSALLLLLFSSSCLPIASPPPQPPLLSFLHLPPRPEKKGDVRFLAMPAVSLSSLLPVVT